MRSTGNSRAGLMAAMAIAMLGAGHVVAEPVPLRHAGKGNNHRPTPPRRNTALAREIAEHNEAVERQKAEKKAGKRGR